jgi:hypothetical protein
VVCNETINPDTGRATENIRKDDTEQEDIAKMDVVQLDISKMNDSLLSPAYGVPLYAVAGNSLTTLSDKTPDLVSSAAPLKRKRSESMDEDIWELENLNLYDDISSRKRLYQLRYFKRTQLNREITIKEDGAVVLGRYF